MNIAICEDRHADSAALCKYIEEYFFRMSYKGNVQVFESGEDFLNEFSSGAFDIIFLDINLPGLTGMETAYKIRETDLNCHIIFVSVSMDYLMDGFLVGASSYVIKPFEQDKMDNAMYRCREILVRNARTIDVPLGRKETVPLKLPNIYYIEVYQKSTHFHTADWEFTSYLSLDEVESILGGGPFLRCHRSYIVNMNHVAEIGEQDFHMTNGVMVPIRKNGKKEIRLALARFKAGSGAGAVRI